MTPTPDQIIKLQSLGLSLPAKTAPQPVLLAGLSGLTFLSFGGLILLKTQQDSSPKIPNSKFQIPDSSPTPTTQIKKSIQHYLLSSQQFFSQALELQNQNTSPDQSQIISLLNQSLTSAAQAISEFPSDYRGWLQRGHIYQSLVDSDPKLLATAIADFSQAQKLNPSSGEITRSLAALYAKKGDAQNTLSYLSQTIVLEPTKAQHFYDLARLQQQVGLVKEALATYTQLLPLISDPSQKIAVESEKSTLEKIVSSSPASPSLLTPPPIPSLSLPDAPSLIQADSLASGIIIAAPESSKSVSVSGITSSNSLSGSSLLPAGQSSLVLQNSRLKSTSQIYLTITKGSKNEVLRLLSRSDTSFTVGFDQPQSADTEFKWWIIDN